MIKLRENTKQVTAATIVGEIQLQIIQVTNGGGLTDAFNKANPWSAAFISYVIKTAGISDFPVNASHALYAEALRKNPSKFQVLDPSITTIQVGDLVVANRDGNTLAFRTGKWSGNTHGDIITSISGNTAKGIGGNIGQSVGVTNIGLVNGKLGRSDYFVVLRPTEKVSSIVNVAEEEYNKWKKDRWKETTPAALSTLREYYKVVGITI